MAAPVLVSPGARHGALTRCHAPFLAGPWEHAIGMTFFGFLAYKVGAYEETHDATIDDLLSKYEAKHGRKWAGVVAIADEE